MKRYSLPALNSFITLCGSPARSAKTSLLVVLLCLAGFKGFSNVSVSPASGGSSICSTVATSPTNVGTITITEGASNDFPTGASQLVLAPPAGWSFVAVLPTITATGGDVTIGIVSISTSALTINFSASGTTHTDVITIANLQVQAASSSSLSGNIFAQSDLGIAGIATGATGTPFGLLQIVSAVTPSVTISGAPTGAICAGTGITFTPSPVNGGASPTYQFFVNGSSVGTSSFYATSTLANGNTVNAIMTATAGGCYTTLTATSNTYTATVNPVPAAVTVTGGGAVCGTTTLNASNGGSGTIYFQGTTSGGTSIATPSSSQVITTSGTYYFRALSAGGCWGTEGSASVVVSSLPSTVSVTGGGTFCGGTTTLNASNAGDGIIYYQGIASAGTSTATPSTSQVISTSGTYYFRALSAGGCWGTPGSATVTINAIPTTVTASGAGTFCGSTIITAANGGSGTIYFQGTTSGGTSTAIPSASQTVTASGTYYFRAQSAGGCWGTEGSVTVTINTAPTANAGTAIAVCSGGTATLAGSIGGSATSSTWTAASGTFSNPASVTSTYTPVIGSGVVTLTLTTNDPDGAGPCAAATSTVNVTVSAQPTVVTASGGGSFCNSATITAANGGSGTIYFQGTTSNGTSTATPSASQVVSVTGTYFFRAQSAGGCWGPQGSVSVTVNPLPTAYAVTGGGGYCTGSTGSDVGLSFSDAGVNYQLLRGGVPVGAVVPGTNASLDFGLQTIAATYTIQATNPSTGCTQTMSGNAIVAINSLPTAFTVTGSGAYCSGGTGVAVGLSGSATGVNYQLKLAGSPVGSSVPGVTGSPITFGPQTTAGTYTVMATNATTGCTANMLSSATVTVNPSPATFSITGGGAYCAGSTGVLIGLAGSTSGISYQLYKGLLTSGSPVTGTGSALSFGLQTTATSYTIVATNPATLCTSTMTGVATVSVNPVPGLFGVTGGGDFCAGGTGVDVSLSGSATGINYQLSVGGVATGAELPGTGTGLDFGLQTTGGNYTVTAIDATTLCSVAMTGTASVTVNPSPTAFTITGGGSYCTGGSGLAVGLSGSQSGVTYQLYNSFASFGSPISGTGSAVSYGLETTSGFYTVIGTNTATGCTNNMTGGVAITILPLPNVYTVTGGGGYCTGGTGTDVGLNNSDIGVNYLLYRSGIPVGIPVAGTGTSLDYGMQTLAGPYTVIATDASTTCTSPMTGTATISINPLPGVFTVTGGGTICAGSTGVAVGLGGSATGINYQLFDGVAATGATVAGTGSSITFGLQTAGGTYTVVANDAVTGCTNNMTGSILVSVNPAPAAFSVTGGGDYCAGGTGVDVGLSGSNTGINYQLMVGGVATGSSVPGTAGFAIDFGLQTVAGNYTVSATDATTACTSTMLGSANVVIDPLPNVFTLGGGGGYCATGTGVDITLSGSQAGVSYQLFVGGAPVSGIVPGTGSLLDFGLMTTAGTYSCVATSAAGCTNNMSGAPVITINSAPAVFNVTGTGSFCTGGAGVDVGLDGSVPGVNYQLFADGVAVGTPLPGFGGALDFGFETTSGTYTIVATDPAVTCSANMAGSAVVTEVPYPVIDAITGPSLVCQGSSITLTDDSTGGVWSSATSASATVDAFGNVSGVASGTETISYTITNPTGCATSVTVDISVLAAPAVSPITGTSNICAASTFTFTDATTGGVWSSSDVTIATAGSAGTITGVSTGIATITYTFTNSAGCSAFATFPVSVGNAIPVSALIPASATICHNMAVGLSVVTSGSSTGLTYQWYQDGTAIPGATNSTDSATIPGHYTATISNGTCTQTFPGTTVLAPPVPIISLDTLPNLLFTGAFSSFQWLLNGTVITGATTNNVSQGNTLGAIYNVIVSDANGCIDTSAAFIVTDSAVVRVAITPSAKEIRIYPNPATSVIHIDAPVKVWVSIVSPDGSILVDRKEAISMNVGQLSEGMYMIMVYDENNKLLKTEKFVKMK